ncbi:MAG: phosphoribosylaminoimidazolesuccinocarboxamide synthase [Acidimicrobiia bacterium]|nr:phosphoribosylaminoimidazolesuccinocarboxamide synthase [Acidimicrobiia bacterium]
MTLNTDPNYSQAPSVPELEALGLHHLYGGKVRDIYAVNDDQLLLVASDRISAYDVIMSEAIPEKGAVLNGISAYWFENTKDIITNHVVSTDATDFPFTGASELLHARSVLVQKTLPIRLEAIVRGYIFGHGYSEYLETGQIHGHQLREGLRLSEKLPNPIFTPTSKAEEGHDESVSVEIARDLVGAKVYDFIKDASIALYEYGVKRANDVGIILADTKFEFGFIANSDGALSGGKSESSIDDIILIDEAMTPDSSRYWESSTYSVGISPASFDKQFLRDWLEAQPWDKTAPAPTLPQDVIFGTRERYVEAYERITGDSFSSWVG